MATLLIALLAACSGSAPAEPTPAPEPVEEPAPAPEPEPEPEANVVNLTFGKKCEEPAEGEPADLEAVKAALAAANVEVTSIEEGMVCDACGTCPRMAVIVTTPATEADVRAAFGPAAPADGLMVLDVGRKCDKPAKGAPVTQDEVLAKLAEAGIEVVKYEARMACQACGCPEISLDLEVPPDQAAKVAALAAMWTPPKKEGGSLPNKGKAKSSLP